MWFYFLKYKNPSNKINLTDYFDEKSLEIKNKDLNNLVITNIIKFFKVINTYDVILKKNNKLNALYYYANVDGIFQKSNNYYNAIMIFKLKKKQLYSSFLILNNLKKLITNGMLLKKLNIKKKSQKKDTKLSTLNIQKIREHFLENNFRKNIIINLVGVKNNIIKLVNTIKICFAKNRILWIINTKISFSKNKFKKIKSIKKKLKKKYNPLN